MFEAGQNWDLFGYDMRHIGKYWSAAWRDLLRGYDSPVRLRLDDVVKVHGESNSVSYYQAGSPCPEQATECSAIALPDDRVLWKELHLPLAVESDLDAVLALEVMANSPFPGSDTGYGWRRVGRDEAHIRILLAIVSMSATMTYLGRHYDSHDTQAQEVWAEVDGSMVVIRGFGENARETRYGKRLLRAVVMLSIIAAALMLCVGLATGFKSIEARRVAGAAEIVTLDAAQVSQLRVGLATANDTITAANAVIENYPSPHVELARLTRLLGDDASLIRFSINGNEIRIHGVAQDAATVMKLLTDEPGYAGVTAPQAITRVGGNSEMEVFHLDIRLPEGSGE